MRGAVLDDAEVSEFFRDLFRQVGLDAGAYRSCALRRRVAACLRFLRVGDLKRARQRLEQRPDLVAAAIDVVLLGVTDFCRDPAVFDSLRTQVIPLLARNKAHVRVWSAACSDGRELFSLAALLADAGLLPRAELLGTDCRLAAIEAARVGRYPAELLGRVEPWLSSYLLPRDGAVSLCSEVRQAISWKQADVLAGAEPGPWDLISWRNMAIYLTSAEAARVWRLLVGELAPGGFLVVGKADAPPRGLPLEKAGSCIYRKVVFS